MKAGDRLEVFTPGKRFECELSEIREDGIDLCVTKELPHAGSSRIHIAIAQALPKGERFEWLIQKSTEIGVAEILPLVTERTVVRPANVDAKLQRWNEIAEQAAGQSENSFPCFVHEPRTLDMLVQLQFSGLKLLLHEREGSVSLRSLMDTTRSAGGTPTHAVIAVGPEGGWSENETQSLEDARFSKIHLGPRILRAETAGIVIASILQYECGDFSD